MPKLFLPEIIWHSKDDKHSDRVYSIDWSPSDNYRVVTGGADEFVHIWELEPSSYHPKCVGRINAHEGEVNCVKWSQNGDYIISGGSDGFLFLWKPDSKPSVIPFGMDSSSLEYEEFWDRSDSYRFTHPITTFSWNYNSNLIIVGNEIGDVVFLSIKSNLNFQFIRNLHAHSLNVQGIVTDGACNHFFSQSADQTLKVWNISRSNKPQLVNVGRYTDDKYQDKHSKTSTDDRIKQNVSYFVHESDFKSFFRRLDISPDSKLLACPAGNWPDENNNLSYCTMVFPVITGNKAFYPRIILNSLWGIPISVKFSQTFNLLEDGSLTEEFETQKIDWKVAIGSNEVDPRDKPGITTSSAPVNMQCGMLNHQMEKFEKMNIGIGRQTVEIKAINEINKMSDISDIGYSACNQENENRENRVSDEVESLPRWSNSTKTDDSNVEGDDKALQRNKKVVLDCDSTRVDPQKDDSEIEIPLGMSICNSTDDVMIAKLKSNEFQQDSNRTMNSDTFEYSETKEADVEFFDQKGVDSEYSDPNGVDSEYSQRKDVEFKVIEEFQSKTHSVLAVGTDCGSLIIYSTKNIDEPIAVIRKLHYASINQIAWSADGYKLAIAGGDGYCSFIEFSPKELGIRRSEVIKN